MNRNVQNFSFLVVALVALGGCSSERSATDSRKAGATPDRIQGKAQVLLESSGASDAALNAGGSSIYIWVGTNRYRLFLKTPVEVVHGNDYIAEGVYAQRVIDEIGDPDQGKNGYPLQASCERVVRTAWSGESFDVTDGQVSLLRTRIKRYPARPVFLVNRLTPVAAKEGSAEAKKAAQSEDEDTPEISVAADKQRALLIEGSAVQTSPLWEPAGGTVQCKVIIGRDGKIAELETGSQLCESVAWSQFRYQPTVQGGHPVKVKTGVEVRFDPRKPKQS